MPNTTKCPYCGAELEAIEVTVGDKTFHVGSRPCNCEQARGERMNRLLNEENARLDAERRRLDRDLRAAGVPPRYRGLDTAGFEHYVELVLSGTGLYLYGPQGSGKTRAAMAVATELVRLGKTVAVEIVPNLLDSMRSRSSEDRDRTEKLSKSSVLVLDDLGKENPTPYACERLFQIINDRYNAMLPIIATSNYSRGTIAARLSEGDTGRSIASRLAETTESVFFDGKDWRLG